MNPLTDALWAIDDHHHATKASITTDQKFQSIERKCEGCIMWRLFYSKHKLSKGALWLIYSCGAELKIAWQAWRCLHRMFAAMNTLRNYEDICIYCAADTNVFGVSQCDVNIAKLATQF